MASEAVAGLVILALEVDDGRAIFNMLLLLDRRLFLSNRPTNIQQQSGRIGVSSIHPSGRCHENENCEGVSILDGWDTWDGMAILAVARLSSESWYGTWIDDMRLISTALVLHWPLPPPPSRLCSGKFLTVGVVGLIILSSLQPFSSSIFLYVPFLVGPLHMTRWSHRLARFSAQLQ